MAVKLPDSAPKTGRDMTIDAAKGIGILLVVLSHIYYEYGPLTYIYSFHMPLFFLLAGMVFRPDRYASFGQFFKRKLRSLVCPYVFFYLTALLINCLMTVGAGGIEAFSADAALRSLIQMITARGVTDFSNNPLWFVPCLLCVEILYFFISKLKRPWIVLICTLLVGFGWLLKSGHLPFGRNRFYWNADVAFFAIGYYAIGNLLSRQTRRLLSGMTGSRHNRLLCLAAAAVCFALILPPAIINGKISLGSTIYGNGLLLYLTGTVGSLAALFAAAAFRNCPFLRNLGRNTFAIMGCHYMIRNVFNALCTEFFGQTYNNQSILQSLSVFVLILTLTLLCTFLYRSAAVRHQTSKNAN